MRMAVFELRRESSGYPILAQITQLDSGIHVLLTGGQRSHVGAVTMAQNGQIFSTVDYPGHREAVITERWAKELSGLTHDDVTVACGIHYDKATKEQIETVIKICEEMLAQVCGYMGGRGSH